MSRARQRQRLSRKRLSPDKKTTSLVKRAIPPPVFRRLRGYSVDPSLSVQLDTARANEAVFKIQWEASLKPGPVGEYLEVVDYDPASGCFYAPVDLNDPHILAQDGLSPSESDPGFHQQMVYAVAMTTIQNFEKALGRKALWSSTRNGNERGYLQHLRIYPHALRQANAYYSPVKKALLFGYFPASSSAPGDHIPNGIVFTCLSHDIVAHETTHALLDGMHRRFIEDSHPDTLAFHEAFADIVALFQHFSFPEVLRQQIAKTRGDLASQNLLGELAQQFGRAIGQYGALRDAIGEFDKEEHKWRLRQPDPNDYQTVQEPHARGAILVAAVFEAFLSIYKSRVADLLRIASNGTGVLTPGELHPDLVNRLASEAAKTAQHVLNMCIRALDYCPPVDINFGDYLRAIVTADIDIVHDDDRGYRIAFIEAFRRRGIYPRDIRTLSEESLSWNRVREEEQQGILVEIASRLHFFVHQLTYLDEFPQSKSIENLSDHDKAMLKKNLIPGKEQRWAALGKEEKENAWKQLFDKPLVPKKPMPTAEWEKLKQAEKDDVERVLWLTMSSREKIYSLTRAAQRALHKWFVEYKLEANPNEVTKLEALTGLCFLESAEKDEKLKGLRAFNGKYTFEVHSFRGAQRVGPDGDTVDEVVIALTQSRSVGLTEQDDTQSFLFRGGCTLILDLKTLRLKYVVNKYIDNRDRRLDRQRAYRTGEAGASLRATYLGRPERDDSNEPFALLHSDL